MAVTSDKPAPYAPPATVLDVVMRHRDRGLPKPINAEVLARSGVSDSLIPRTLQTMQTLELIDDSGEPTPTFETIRKAPQPELQSRMAEWLNSVYADVLHFVDPATAEETAIRDAFRNYQPVGQQARMVSLFTRLYAAAGVGPERPATTVRVSRNAAARPRPAKAASAAKVAPPKGKPSRTDSPALPPAPPAHEVARTPYAVLMHEIYDPKVMGAGSEEEKAVFVLARYLRSRETA